MTSFRVDLVDWSPINAHLLGYIFSSVPLVRHLTHPVGNESSIGFGAALFFGVF